MIPAVRPEAVAGISQPVLAELIAETMCIAEIIQFIPATLTFWNVMVDGPLQVRMAGERQAANPTFWINGLKDFLFAGYGHLTRALRVKSYAYSSRLPDPRHRPACLPTFVRADPRCHFCSAFSRCWPSICIAASP